MKKIMTNFMKSDSFSAVFSLINSNMFVSIVAMAISIIQAKLVTAEELGYFRQFGIITNYLFFLHLGTYQAVERLYPLYIGKGDEVKAKKVVSVAEAWIALVSIPISIILTLLGIWNFAHSEWKAALGWIAQAVAMLTTVYGGFIKATYRSGQDFKKMARAQYLTPLFSLLAIPIYFVSSYVGLFIKNICTLPATVLMYLKRPIKERKTFEKNTILEVFKNGLPRFSSSYALTTGIEAVRSTLILQQLGKTALGYWSFTWTIYGLVRQIPQSISAVYAPKVTQEYGKTGDYHACLKMCRKPMLICAGLSAIIIPIGVWGSLFVLPKVLPNYADASGLLAATVGCFLPTCILDLPWQVINSMDKPGTHNVFAFLDFLIQSICILLSIHWGYGVFGIVFGSICGSIVRAICIFLFFNKLKKRM